MKQNNSPTYFRSQSFFCTPRPTPHTQHHLLCASPAVVPVHPAAPCVPYRTVAMFFWKQRASADEEVTKYADNAKYATAVFTFLLAVRCAPYLISKLT